MKISATVKCPKCGRSNRAEATVESLHESPWDIVTCDPEWSDCEHMFAVQLHPVVEFEVFELDHVAE